MQKLWLKDFEFNINPATWNTAQDIHAAGGVRSLREVEKHFWVALVEESIEARYEIEAIITPHKIKAFTCECWSEGRRLICPHIAAALLTIRQFLDKKAEERKAKAEQQAAKEDARFTIQTVLAKVEPEQLAGFVREYARRDRDFALALKTWFAAEQEDAATHFRQLLESVVPRPQPGKPVSEPDFRRLRKMLDDLETQLESARGQGNFRTVFSIGSVILQRITPLLDKTDATRRQTLLWFCQMAFDKMTVIESENLSPELRAGIWDFLFECAEKGLFPPEMHREAIRYLSEKATEDSKFEQINALFDRTPTPAPPFLLHLYLAALARRGMERAGLRVLEDYSDKPLIVKEAIIHLYYMQHWAATLTTGEHFLETPIFNAPQRREVEDILLQIAEKTKDRRRMLRLYRERFALTGSFSVLQKLKTTAADKWPTELERLLDLLKKKNDAKNIAAVLAEEGQTEVLANFIAQQNSPELLQRYENHFLEHDRDFLRRQYVETLTAYLREHFGRTASSHVRERLSGLVQKGERDFVKEICAAIIANFDDRPSLAEELAELYPKKTRR